MEQKYTTYIEIFQDSESKKWTVKFEPPHPANKFGEFDLTNEYDTYEEAKEKFDFYIQCAKESGLELTEQTNGDSI